MAQVGGAAGTFAYSTAGNDPQVAEVEEWTADFPRVTRNTTPAGWVMERFYVGRQQVRGRFRLSANDTEMAPLPSGLIGVMSLTSSVSKIYTFDATITRMVFDFSSPRDSQVHVYEFVGSAALATNAIEDDHA